MRRVLDEQSYLDFSGETSLKRRLTTPNCWRRSPVGIRRPSASIQGITADTGFRAVPEEMAKIEKHVDTVAVPGRGQSRAKIDAYWHHFRAGVEGSISVLKRAFRLSICMYRGFKSFAAAVGMAVFCHNLVNLAPKRVPA